MQNQFSPLPGGWGAAVGTPALPQSTDSVSHCVLRPPAAPRLQEIPAGAAGVKGEQDGLANPDFYGVLGTDQDQTAAST